MHRGHYDDKLEQTRDGGLIVSDHMRGRSTESIQSHRIHSRSGSEEFAYVRVVPPRGNSVVTLNRQDGAPPGLLYDLHMRGCFPSLL